MMGSRNLAAPAWALVSFGLFVAALFGALVVDAAVNVVVELPHLFTMAEWSLVWGGLGIVGMLIAGRLAFGGWLRVDAAGLVLAGVGIGLPAVVHVVLQQWAGDRFGYYDPDMVGLTAGQFALLVLVGNLPGMGDGIRVDAWPLALWLGASGVYAVLTAVACVARVRGAARSGSMG